MEKLGPCPCDQSLAAGCWFKNGSATAACTRSAARIVKKLTKKQLVQKEDAAAVTSILAEMGVVDCDEFELGRFRDDKHRVALLRSICRSCVSCDVMVNEGQNPWRCRKCKRSECTVCRPVGSNNVYCQKCEAEKNKLVQLWEKNHIGKEKNTSKSKGKHKEKSKQKAKGKAKNIAPAAAVASRVRSRSREEDDDDGCASDATIRHGSPPARKSPRAAKVPTEALVLAAAVAAIKPIPQTTVTSTAPAVSKVASDPKPIPIVPEKKKKRRTRSRSRDGSGSGNSSSYYSDVQMTVAEQLHACTKARSVMAVVMGPPPAVAAIAVVAPVSKQVVSPPKVTAQLPPAAAVQEAIPLPLAKTAGGGGVEAALLID